MSKRPDTLESLGRLLKSRGSELAGLRGVESIGIVPDADRPALMVCLSSWNPLARMRAMRRLRGHRVVFRVTGGTISADKRRRG